MTTRPLDRLDVVPLGIKARKRVLEVSSFEEADWVLYDILSDVSIQGQVSTIHGDTAVSVACVPNTKLNVTACYIHRDHPLHVLGKMALLKISRIQFGPNLFPYGPLNNTQVMEHCLYITKSASKVRHYSRYPILKSWFDLSAEPPVEKISGRHIRHLTFKELSKVGMDYYLEEAGFILPMCESLASKGMTEAMAVGLLTWAALLPKDFKQVITRSALWTWRFHSMEDFFVKVKSLFTSRLKAIQNLVPLDLTPIFEFEVIVNRGTGSVDWNEEVLHRTSPDVANFRPQDVYQAARKLFSRAVKSGGRPTKLNWTSHWEKRWMWAPTGSYRSQYPQDNEYKARDVNLRHKMFALSAMPMRELSHFTDRRPEMQAWASTKYEWGKQRAIYCADVTSFVMSSFGFAGCEELLSTIFPIGPAANKSNVKAAVTQVLANGIPFCFDFEDFNSQHSTASMQMVLLAYKHAFEHNLTAEQHVAVDWVIKSLDNSHISVDTDGEMIKTSGTLLSGWRLTTFVNTVLNKVYLDLAGMPPDIVSTHNGDDVLCSIKRLSQVQSIARGAKNHNIRFQPSKCYLGAVAEFLRVDHKTGSGAQYLTRAVSTLVHGPTETAVPTDITALVTAIHTRGEEIRERGGYVPHLDHILRLQYETTARLWGVSLEDVLTYTTTHVSKGGLSREVSKEALSHRVDREYLPRRELAKGKEDESRQLPGTHDYARAVCRAYNMPQYVYKVKDAAKKAIFKQSTNYKFGLSVTKRDPDSVDWLRAVQYGMLKGVFPSAQALLAKAYGIPLAVILPHTSSLLRYLSSEKDLIAALTLMA